MGKGKRTYVQTARRMLQEKTRQRIVEAIVALHQELGPKNTTIAAIAKRAGVQRLTVYRHFEDENAMFLACSGHWISQNPPPDEGEWETIKAFPKRVQAALNSIYQYYARTAPMLSKIYRDADEVAALGPIVQGVDQHFTTIADNLSTHLSGGRSNHELKATARHLVRFATWQSLSEEGLTNRKMAQVGWKCLRALAR